MAILPLAGVSALPENTIFIVDDGVLTTVVGNVTVAVEGFKVGQPEV